MARYKELKEFVKIETRLINDPRFFTLSEFDQLIYVKLLILAKLFNNRIDNDMTILKQLLRTDRSESDIEVTLDRLKSKFKKFNRNKYFYFFKDFHNRLIHKRTDKDKDKDKDKEKEKNKKKEKFDFLKLYEKYPRKEGKTHGLTRCKSQIKSSQDYAQLEIAIKNYAQAKNGTENKFIMLFSTFMNKNWKDWIMPHETIMTGKTQLKGKNELSTPEWDALPKPWEIKNDGHNDECS